MLKERWFILLVFLIRHSNYCGFLPFYGQIVCNPLICSALPIFDAQQVASSARTVPSMSLQLLYPVIAELLPQLPSAHLTGQPGVSLKRFGWLLVHNTSVFIASLSCVRYKLSSLLNFSELWRQVSTFNSQRKTRQKAIPL